MLELRDATGLAEKPRHIRRLGQAAVARDLDRHKAVQLGITGFVDGAEGADAHLFEQLELAEALGDSFGQPAGGGIGVKLDAGTAPRANDFARRLAFPDDRALAMRTLEAHSLDLVVSTVTT